MRTLIDIQDSITDAQLRRVRERLRLSSAKRNRDPVVIASAGLAIISLEHRLVQLALELAQEARRDVDAATEKLSVRAIKRRHAAILTNVRDAPMIGPAPKLRTTNYQCVPMRGAKPGSAFTGPKGRNMLERSPIKGLAPSDRHSQPHRLKANGRLAG